MEFDEDGMGGLAEGQYLTAEEKAAILRGFEEDDASESEIESEAEEGTGDEEAGGDGEGGGLPGIRPVDEELQGVRGLRRKGGDESQADDEQEGDGEGDNAEAEETQQQVRVDVLFCTHQSFHVAKIVLMDVGAHDICRVLTVGCRCADAGRWLVTTTKVRTRRW